MKRIAYILALTLLNLFAFGIEAYAQVIEEFENASLQIDRECSVAFHFPQTYIDPEYEKESEAVRLSHKEYLLKPLKNKDKQIRVVTDKGLLLRKSTYGNIYWEVKKLNENEKRITISFFNHNTNQLIGETTYNLTPIYDYNIGISYIDTNGKKCTFISAKNHYKMELSNLSIDYGKPMKVFAIRGEEIIIPIEHLEYIEGEQKVIEGDEITESFISELKALKKGSCKYITNVRIIGIDGIMRILPAIEMKK